MVRLPPKKGPRMTVASQRTSKNQDTENSAFESEVNSLARKTQVAIEAARSKMTAAQKTEADQKARAIFERSNSASSDRKRSA
jgi:hypothetical protein